MRSSVAQQGRTQAIAVAVCALLLVAVAVATALPAGAAAEQASQPTSLAAGGLDAGLYHSCAALPDNALRCWGYGGDGALGYGNTATVGDNEAPGSVGPVDLGAGRTAKATSAGSNHTCVVLDNGSVRCWGFGGNGRLGYANTETIGDNESAGSVGPVVLGGPAKAVSSGDGFTCAVLEDGSVRCWGFSGYKGDYVGSGNDGRLGYANGGSDAGDKDVGDNETPASAGPVDLGFGRTTRAVTSGLRHSCALLDDYTVRCWGDSDGGKLGFGRGPSNDSDQDIGDDETPGSIPPLSLGRPAKAISAGPAHTCAVLDDGAVRCWGSGANGRLGVADTVTVGDNEPPSSVAPVNLGPGRTATAISAGGRHTCAVLDNGSLRCWGYGAEGQLGYPNTFTVGDNETPGSVGPVDLGAGRTALAVSAGDTHTCARLDDGNVRCWGVGANGRLGYCNTRTIGDDETPGTVGPVPLFSANCTAPEGAPPASAGAGAPVDPDPDGLKAQAARLRGLRSCLGRVRAHARREARAARRLSGSRRVRALRHLRRHRSQSRRRCLKRWGRTPGRVAGLKARALSRKKVVLTFRAPGTDGSRPPAARTYHVKQSRRPIRSARAFRRAQTLCKGSCLLTNATRVGATVTVTVNRLRPRTTYYYAVVARDNVSRRLGPRTRAVKARTPG